MLYFKEGTFVLVHCIHLFSHFIFSCITKSLIIHIQIFVSIFSVNTFSWIYKFGWSEEYILQETGPSCNRDSTMLQNEFFYQSIALFLKNHLLLV